MAQDEDNISTIPNNYHTDPNIKREDFDKEFMFGVGTSAYQIEGAWNADGKGLNIWDCFTLRQPGRHYLLISFRLVYNMASVFDQMDNDMPSITMIVENIDDGSNACVTIDSYHKMKEDVRLLKNMGVKYYRFSISWSRILPGGKVSMGKNLEGINYYNKLLDELKANDIKPFVTLFHWDLPNALEEEYMGFLSSKIVDDFVNYAEICFWEFGDRVKNWVTLNEPYRFAYHGYVEGTFPPGRGEVNRDGDPETEPYIVAYNLLNCHAAVYRKYQEDFKDIQNGEVGITLDVNFFKPFGGTKNPNDVKAVEYAYDFMFGLFMEPITSGDWPKNVYKFATTPSQHHPQGRSLPVFTNDQKMKLRHSYDFLGINYYTANYAEYSDSSYSTGFKTDSHYKASGKDPNENNIGEAAFEKSWVYLCALELVDLLSHIKKTYKVEKHIVITENGAPEKNDGGKTYEQVRDDNFRLRYIKWHLEAIRRVNSAHGWLPFKKKPLVMGYFVWSFTDSYEWKFGYTLRFGMNYVDYKNNLHRYPKKSALWFKKFLFSKEKNVSAHLKRRLSDVVEEDEDNGASVEAEQAIEVVQKRNKANA